MLTREENARLTAVGPGTPIGGLLRRYWHPIAASSELAGNETKFVRVLGEDLVLFKDTQGRLGLIGAHCPHRGANLAYGMAEGDGLRCAYHGWKFDRGGRCVEQPFEETARPDGAFKNKVKLPAYSAEELGGLVFAYFGPKPDPLLPRWDLLVEPNVWREIGHTITECNWLQTVENILDPVHVEWLHGKFRNYAAAHTGRAERKQKEIRHLKIGFDIGEYGIIKRRILQGETEESDDWKIGHWLVFPNVQKGPDMLRFRVPVDDGRTAQWYLSVHPLNNGETQRPEEMPLYEMPSPVLNARGQPRWEFLDGDVDVQDNAIFASQGILFDRTRENLGDTDRGIVLYRHLLDAQLKNIEAGNDPMNVFRDTARNVCLKLPTESREQFLTGRLGARKRYSERYRSLLGGRTPLP
jgi:5,5'-dehydrodivanillate O-demethylase